MKYDPKSLQVFISVVEEGTIARAAEREHIAAAAISKRISELEAVLHTQLLTRTNKGVEPTAAGIRLLNLARRALNELADVYLQMQDYASGVRGHVRVFANISAITQFLPRELNTFLQTYPQVQIHLEERISTVITKAVAENAADIGIFTLGQHPPGVEVLPYRHDNLVLIVPRGHALGTLTSVRFSETLNYDYVGLHIGSAINTLLQNAAASLERTLRFRMQVTGYDVLCLMVAEGLGVGVLPELVARKQAAAVRLDIVKLDESWAHRELKICVRDHASLPVAARLLVDHLQDNEAKVS